MNSAQTASPTKIPPLHFKWPWRDYQTRVLEAVRLHLADRRLHVVAPPGSGKTTLGLEVFRLLGKPALVLSPTRTIRDQWIKRLRDFVPEGEVWPASWISNNFQSLRYFNSITYQAIHAHHRKTEQAEQIEESDAQEQLELDAPPSEQEVESLVTRLKNEGIGTLILDEAHHLRSEWWKALAAIQANVPGLTLVSLTGTPPYDVTSTEWNRYQELCGPIDEEISVPELVQSGTLCPHQDYVWIVPVSLKEKKLLNEHEQSVVTSCNELLKNELLLAAVQDHPWVCNPLKYIEDIIANPNEAVSLLVFLKTRSAPLPESLLGLLDAEQEDIPGLTRAWWEVVLQSWLHSPHWQLNKEHEEERKRVSRLLRARHLLRRRKISLTENRTLKSRMSLSAEKIKACVEINRAERRYRKDALRQVVLTDFIRDEIKNSSSTEMQLGAWPIFRELVLASRDDKRDDIALLTGRLCVVHKNIAERLRTDTAGELYARPINGIEDFVSINIPGQQLVDHLTKLFSEGALRVLVGTRSLLGEGWDAPALNSLILASFVGSYMLTNQMRGRAIRRDPSDPNKVASIWHLVGLYRGSPFGLADYFELRQRFETFVGISERKDVIENGLDRLATHLDAPLEPHLSDSTQSDQVQAALHNWRMKWRLFRNRKLLKRWRRAIDLSSEHRVVATIKTPRPPRAYPLHFRNTLKFLLLEIAAIFSTVFYFATNSVQVRDREKLLFVLLIAGIGCLIYATPKLLKAAYLLIMHLPVDGTVRQMGIALRDTLCACGMIETAPERLPVQCEEHGDGSVSIYLGGATFYEQSLFADCMLELLAPIENPRYVIVRHGATGWWKKQDYHAVPNIIGARKEYADTLLRAWQRRLGKSELIYTRRPEGRLRLLKAKARAFANARQDVPKRKEVWR